MFKKHIKEITSLLISIVMMMEFMPLTALAEAISENDPILLEYVKPYEENDYSFSISTLSSSVDEGKSYIVNIERNNAASEAAVFLRTIDMSAVYGEDYIISDKNYKTSAEETNGTILKQSADIQEQKERSEAVNKELEDIKAAADNLLESSEEDSVNSKSESSVSIAADDVSSSSAANIETEAFTKSSNEINNEINSEAVNEINSEAVNEISSDDSSEAVSEISSNDSSEADNEISSSKSSLAALKELQTGKAVRKTSNTDFEPIENLLTQDIINNAGNLLEYSSSTELVFKDGESQKQIVIKILDDSISEGTEIIDLMLADASEGWNVGANINCTLTIKDDENTEHSTISFSQASYDAANGTAQITVLREGAEYSLVTAMVRTVQSGSAVEGTNYAQVNTLVELAPYINEKTFNIPVSADKKMDFSVELYDIKGGEAGEIQSASVTIVPPEEYSANSNIVPLSDDENEKSFTINLSGKDYSVSYIEGESVGYILDESFNPPVTVGEYYFPMDNSHGGSFDYGHYAGDSSGTNRESEYIKPGSENAGEQGAGHLYWYNWSTWKQGSSICYTTTESGTFLNTRTYQYISSDWKQSRDSYGGQYVEMNLHKNWNYFKNIVVGVTGKFSRMMSKPITFLDSSNLPVAKDINVQYQARDKESSKTPKIELYIYGLAAMYRKFKVNLEQPSALTYLDANGNTVNKAPAVVEAAEGHETRFFGQDYQIKAYEPSSGEPIKGTIKEYIITVGTTPTQQVTFNYTPKGNNIQNISFDKDFIKLIDDHTKQISTEGYGFYTQLTIKPVFEYIDVQVDVLQSSHGKFNSNKLSPGTHNFHVGDEFLLNGTPNDSDYKFVGFNEKAYKNKSDTMPMISGDMDSTNTVLRLDYERYTLTPNFSLRDNYIGIKLTDNAKKYLTILNTAENADLTDDIRNDISSGLIDYVLIAESGADSKKTVPVTGKAYHIQAVSSSESYIPVYSLSSNNYTAVGACFDCIAMPSHSDNIVTIDVKNINPGNIKIFALEGSTTIPSNTIRSTASKIAKQGASQVNITGGGEESYIYNTAANTKMKLIDRKSTTSDENGLFSLKGIKGLDGDVITVYITNGDIDCVEYIKLSSSGLNESEIQYTEMVYTEENGEKKSVETPVTKMGYVMNAGELDLPVRTPLAPYVSSITYTVDQINDLVIDTRNNEIPIVATKIYITAALNLNGRDVKAVVFTKVSKNGAKEEMRVDKAYDGQLNYQVSYKMDSEFESGDMLYVKIIDAEDRTVTTNYIDDVTGEERQTTTKEEREYFNVPTGLSFYVPTLEVEPQSFDLQNTATVNVPILGNLGSSMSTGSVSFDKIEYPTSDGINNPYTLQFLFSPGVSTIQKNTALTTLGIIKQGTSAASQQLKSTPEAEEEQLYAGVSDLFNEKGTATADFEKKYSSMAFKKSVQNISKNVLFDAHMLVILSWDFFYDNETNQYVMTSGQYCLGAYFTVAHCLTYVLYGIPLYLKTSGTLGANVSGNYITDNSSVINQYTFSATSNISELLNMDTYVTATLGGSAAVGIGLCGVIGARGIVSFNITTKLKATTDYENDEVLEGFLAKLGGGFGVDLLLFSFEYAPSLLTYGYGCYEGLSDGIVSFSEEEPTIRKIDKGTADMSSFGNDTALYRSSIEPVSSTVLLENAMERTRPKITTLSDGRKFMVFLANDGTRSEANSCCVMYSVSDENGGWSAPVKLDDDGTVDTLPNILEYNGNVIVVWSDANKTFTDDDLAKDILSSFEIAYSVFDTNTTSFSEKTVITNDDFMDTAVSAYIDNEQGNICLYYVKRDIKTAENDKELIDIAATYSTLACSKYDLSTNLLSSSEKYLDILHDRIVDPLIIDFSAKKNIYNNKQYVWMTYTVDEDEDLNTFDDREVYLILEDLSAGKVYYPIAISNNYVSDVTPKLTNFNGSIYLSWIEDAKVLKMIDLTSILEQMDNDGVLEKYLENTEQGWYAKTAGELGMSAEEYEKSIYSGLAEHNLISFEKNFSTNESITRVLGNYELYNDHDKNLYAFWTEAGSTEIGDGNSKMTSSELFGAIFEQSDDDDDEKFSGWSNAVQITDFGKVIDEFSLTFDENENMSMVSNMFSQNIDEKGVLTYSKNNLTEIEFSRNCSLSLKDDISFSKIPVPNDDVTIEFEVINDGLLSTDGYEISVKQVQGSKSEVIYSENTDNQLVSGYIHSCSIPWNVPADISNTSVVVEIKEKNSSNSVVYEKPVDLTANIEISDESAEFDADGNLYLNATLTNSGNTASGSIVLSAYKNITEDNRTKYGTYTLESIEAGKSTDVHYELSDFNAGTELTKYGYADILCCYNIAGNEEKSTVVRAIAPGVVDIVVNDGISEINLTDGQTAVISAAVIPENTANHEISFKSNNTDAAIISANGEITPVGNGSAEITLLHIASGFEKTIKVNTSGIQTTEATTESNTEATTESNTEATTVNNTDNTASNSAASGGGSSSIKASFAATVQKNDNEISDSNEKANIKTSNIPFTDVADNAWYAESVAYVYENGIFSGISSSLFGPDINTSRGMAVTVLGRMANVNPSDYANTSFTDVNPDMYYAPYINWAAENNIAVGFDNNIFKPDDNITREQLTSIIRNYLAYIGEDISIDETELPFSDASLISDWAKEGVQCCYKNEIISGDNHGRFNPKDNATRAEFASIIMRMTAE